jgi:hypothetical protein
MNAPRPFFLAYFCFSAYHTPSRILLLVGKLALMAKNAKRLSKTISVRMQRKKREVFGRWKKE